MARPALSSRAKRAVAGLVRRAVSERWPLAVLCLLPPVLLFVVVACPELPRAALAVALPATAPELPAALQNTAGLLLFAYVLVVVPLVASWACGRRASRSTPDLDEGEVAQRWFEALDGASRIMRGSALGPAVPHTRSWAEPVFPYARSAALGRVSIPWRAPTGPFPIRRPPSLYLSLSDLEGMDLEGAWLRFAMLHGANLRGADLGWACLFRADLTFADLGQAFLAAADLRGADLTGANLRGANLCGAKLRAADLSLADLRGANLRAADLQGATLVSVRMDGAKLRGANLEGADLRRAAFTPGQLGLAACLAGAWMPNGTLHP